MDPRTSFVSQAEACRILGVARRRFLRILPHVDVRVYQLPGAEPRYHKGDIQRIAAEAVRSLEPETATA